MKPEEICKILEDHKLWLDGEGEGKRADFRGADFRGEDLHGLDFRFVILCDADFRGADLRDVDFCGADLRFADFRGADLFGSSLRDTDLLGAHLDYSCLPLWCGSLSVNFDDRQLRQIAYHLLKAGLQSKNASKETKDELAKLIDFANEFYLAKECGEIVKISDEEEGEQE